VMCSVQFNCCISSKSARRKAVAQAVRAVEVMCCCEW
jgi:hypothetical protein